MVDPCFETLRDASFRGAPFYVETDTGTVGRRIVTHEYPMRDDPFHEDLGEAFRHFKVMGYVLGIADKDAIVAACAARGPGMLSLPAEAPALARCITLSVTRAKDRQGFFELSMEFRKEGLSSFAPVATSVFERLLNSAIGTATAAIAAGYDAQFAAGNVLPYVSQNAAFRVRSFASQAISVAGTNSVPQAASTSVVLQAQQLSASADALVRTSSLTASPPSAAIAQVGAIYNQLVSNMSPAVAVQLLKPFTQFAVLESPTPQTPPAARISASAAADATNAKLFNGAVRQLGLIAWSQALASYDIPTRAAAIQARADVVEAFNSELQDLSYNADVAVVVQSSRDLIVKSIIDKITTLAPVILIDASASMPSLYWAYRIYADPARAQELVDRNAAPNPLFMPTTFEALSR